MPITSKQAVVPLISLAEYMLRYHSKLATVGQFHSKTASHLFMAVVNKRDLCLPEDLSRALALLATVISEKNQDEAAEKMFLDAIAAAGPVSTFQKAEAYKYYAIFLDSHEGRDEEVSLNVLKAKEVLHDLGIWSPKLMHIVIRDLEY